VIRALAVAAALLALGSASAAPPAPLHACAPGGSVRCGYVVAPLDASGAQAGTVRLYTEFLATRDAVKRGTLLLLAGGPGQASTKVFDLAGAGRILQILFPGYDLVAFDDRGTGRSGALSCPALAAAVSATPDEGARLAGSCGRRLGSRRVFYSTAADAGDMDAVRRALGVDRIAVYGVSYGTRQALNYALAHPAHVSRLLLDSVVPLDDSESFRLPTIRAVPGALGALCGGGACRAVTRDPAGDLARLANRLERRPLVTHAAAVKGKPQRIVVDGVRLLGVALDTDLNRGVAAELPAAVAAALAGDTKPIERLVALDLAWENQVGQVNAATEVATVCADDPFPWPRTATPAQRRPLLAAAVAALGPAATAPFGPWATELGNAKNCEDWPAPAGAAALPKGPPPDVPVLILSGSRDVRTPSSNARRVAAAFPHSTLLVVRGAGHSVLFRTPCAVHYVIAWTSGTQPVPCASAPASLAPLGPFPAAGQSALAAVTATIREALAAGLVTEGLSRTTDGIVGGTLAPAGSGGLPELKLTGYSDTPGVALTGSLFYSSSDPLHWGGAVRVHGSRAATGTLTILPGRVTGTLGGRRVSAKV
jgi:pimeloyl-ACP methyl ester carboxylesterase